MARKGSWRLLLLLGRAVPSLLLSLALLLGGHTVWAKDSVSAKERKNDRAVRLLATVPIPPTAGNTTAKGLYSFDISWVDEASRTYYLADRSNKVVDIVDTTSNILITQLTGGFAGFTGSNDTSGPNGVFL